MSAPQFEREFKTAPVGRRVRCQVTPNGVEILGAKDGHRIRGCDFADVKASRFTEVGLIYMYTRVDMVSRQLRLSGDHAHFTLLQNGGTMQPRTKLDVRPYYESCAAALKALAAIHPDLSIAIGMRPLTRWIFFLVGLLPLTLGAILLLGVALSLNSSESNELATMSVFGLLLLTYGFGLVMMSVPWKTQQHMTPGDLAASLEARLAENKPS